MLNNENLAQCHVNKKQRSLFDQYKVVRKCESVSVNSLRNVKLSIRYNTGLVVWMIKFQKRTTRYECTL